MIRVVMKGACMHQTSLYTLKAETPAALLLGLRGMRQHLSQQTNKQTILAEPRLYDKMDSGTRKRDHQFIIKPRLCVLRM